MTAAAPEEQGTQFPRVFVLLAVATFAAYGNALLWGQFQFDDFNVIVDNPRVHSLQAWLDDLGHGIRPLLKLSYTLDWIAGWGPAGFHFTNVSIHLANVVLVWRLARRLADTMPRLRGQAAAISLLTALLFALHPIHSEAVTYICGRSSALMSLFYLGGLLAYASGCGQAKDSRLLLQVVAPLGFLLALAVKETAVTFPLALLAWELACGGTWKSALRRQWPCWAVLAASGAAFLSHDSYLPHLQASAGLNSVTGNIATQAAAIAWLLKQWAVPLWPNIDPDLPLLDGLSAARPQLALVALLLLVAGAGFRHRPWLGFALAWTLVQLLPLHLLLPRLDVANERQMYLVSWPLAFLLMAEVVILLQARRRALAAVAAALLLVAGGLTVRRNQDYRSEVALWQSTAIQSPNKARVRNNLGYAYQISGRYDEARAEYQTALRLDPAYAKARGNLARMETDHPR